MATHSGILAWRILWTEEPGGLQSTGSQREINTFASLHCPCWSLHCPPTCSLTSEVPASLLTPLPQETPPSLPVFPGIHLSSLDLSLNPKLRPHLPPRCPPWASNVDSQMLLCVCGAPYLLPPSSGSTSGGPPDSTLSLTLTVNPLIDPMGSIFKRRLKSGHRARLSSHHLVQAALITGLNYCTRWVSPPPPLPLASSLPHHGLRGLH